MYEVWKRKQIYEDARKVHGTKIHVKKIGKMRKAPSGGHDLVRRMDRQGEVLIWCGKCENNRSSRGRTSPSQRGKELENRVRKEKNYEKGV